MKKTSNRYTYRNSYKKTYIPKETESKKIAEDIVMHMELPDEKVIYDTPFDKWFQDLRTPDEVWNYICFIENKNKK